MRLELNCTVEYYPNFLSEIEADDLFVNLMTCSKLTKMHEMTTLTGERVKYDFGKTMFINHDLFDQKVFPESIWGSSMLWPKEMTLVRERVEKITSQKFEICVCIFYPDGKSGVEYHSDFVAFGDTSLIPSLSLGEERAFKLREKLTLKEHNMVLEKGSLLIMGDHCQELYEHSLPVNPVYKLPRINLTFRKYGFT